MKRQLITVLILLASLTSGTSYAQEAGIQDRPSEATRHFRDILLRLSQDGDLPRAATELGVLEKRWSDAGFISTLEEAEREFTKNLWDRSHSAIYPVTELFSITHLYHLQRGHSRLARRAIRRVVFSGRLYSPGRQPLKEIDNQAGSAKKFEKPGVLSRNLSRIGLFLMHGNYLDEALERFLLPAVRVDPSSTIPLHLLAAIGEKRDRYSEAIEHLEVLLNIAPEDAHGRLRRAMVWARIGESDSALEELAALIQDEPPVQVKLLAIQEAVALYVETEARDRAIALLRKSLGEFPSEQSLRTLQLWLLPGEASRTIQGLDDLTTKDAMPESAEVRTPRVAYNNWPREEIDELRLRRKEDLEPSLRSLRNLLGSREP